MGKQLEQSGVELIAKNLGQFLSDLNKANAAIADVGSKGAATASAGIAPFNSLGESIIGIGAKAATVAATGLAALGAGVTAIAAKGTMMALDLEQGLANIASKSGQTISEIAPLKELISDLALDPNLKVTTDEAVQGIEALTKQGLDMTQIIEGAGKATVALSNATGGDYGVTASLTAGVMKAFGVEASNLTQVIDGITGVTTNSKFTVDDYALAFSQAGAVAASLGVDLQDFNTVIAATSSSFSSGSDAGTSFKTLLLRLSAPTKEMETVMKEYGISLFDAEGKMRNMKDIVTQLNTVLQGNATITKTVGGATKDEVAEAERMSKAIPDLTHDIEQQSSKLEILKGELALTAQYYGEGSPKTKKLALSVQDLEYSLSQNQTTLQEYNNTIAQVSGNQAKQVTSTKQLTEAERARIAEALGGADASRLILALSKTSGDEFDKLSGKINANGLAFNAAATRMDTAKGAIEILQGVVEAIQIQIGEKFVPLVKSAAKAMTEWASKNSGKFIAFFGKVSDGIGSFVSRIGELTRVFQTGGLFGVRSAGGLGSSQGILAALGLSPEAITVVQDFFSQVGSVVSNFMSGGIFGTGGDTGGLLASLGLSPEAVALVQDSITYVKELLLSLAPQFAEVSSVADVVSASILFIRDNFTALAGALGGIVTAGIIGTVIAAIAAIATPVTGLVLVAGLLGAAWASNWGDIQGKTAAAWAAIQPVLSTMITWLSTNIPMAITTVSDFWTNTLMPALNTAGAWISANLIPALSQVWDWLATNIPTAITTLSAFWSTTLLPAITTVSDYLALNVMPILSQIGTWLGDLLVADMLGFQEAWDTALPPIMAFGDFMGTTINPLLLSLGNLLGAVVYKSMQAFLGLWKNVLWPAIKDVGAYLSSSLQPAFAAIGEVMDTTVTPPLDNLTSDILPAFSKGMQGIKQIIMDVTGYFNALAESVMSFELPAVLQPGSPTPFELALIGIADATNIASVAIANMGKQGKIASENIDMLLGIDRGINTDRNIIGAAADFIEKDLDRMQLAESKVKFILQRLKKTFNAYTNDILNAGSREQQVAKFMSLMPTNWENAGISKDTVEGAVDSFIKYFQTQKANYDNMLRDMFVKGAETAVKIGNNLNDIIKTNSEILSESLKTRVIALEDLIVAADHYNQSQVEYEGKILTVKQAQDELNKALQEQQELQDQLLVTQQNQQKLDYLEKQLDLLNTIKQAGLNPQDILSGLQLGMDASIPDMIEATNRLVTAMVDQIDKDLQIASPSKVLFKRGDYAGQGFAKGLLNTVSATKAAMQRMMSPLTTGNNSTVNNNYDFKMNVVTGSSTSSVINQYNVMRALI